MKYHLRFINFISAVIDAIEIEEINMKNHNKNPFSFIIFHKNNTYQLGLDKSLIIQCIYFVSLDVYQIRTLALSLIYDSEMILFQWHETYIFIIYKKCVNWYRHGNVMMYHLDVRVAQSQSWLAWFYTIWIWVNCTIWSNAFTRTCHHPW